MTPPIADAAQLAALAGPGGVLSPTDDGVNRLYLDLRADRPTVALSRLASVARAFAPRLAIQEGLRLLVAGGELAPALAAGEFALALPPSAAPGGPRIAAIRGEDVLDQLESLADAVKWDSGYSFRGWLHSETRPVIAAFTPAPRRVVQTALEAGATVVLSRHALPESLLEASPEAGALAPVTLRLVEHFELRATLNDGTTIGALPPHVVGSVELHLGRPGAMDFVIATSKHYDELVEIARRLELAMGAGAFDLPLECLILPRTATVTINVPTESLEFGSDLRTVQDWREG